MKRTSFLLHGAALAGLILMAMPTGAQGQPYTLASPVTSQSARGEVFDNPVIPGFSPDPTICRVGDDYYLACSSFEYFPGVPIYHSRDLVHWELINYALSRPSQLPLGQCRSSSGIYAPALRHHDGTFYLITTNYASDGVFYVTTRDIRGEWSEPVWLGNTNVDPSLLFDDDSKVYLVHPDGGEQGQIFLMEMDMEKGTYKDRSQLPGKFLWMGNGGQYPEGPHLYKINGWYYLMMAEGGTGFEHREIIARSKSPWGPYWPWENNPILTHRDLPDHPIGATGHADIIQIQDGSWWGVFLGVRQKDRRSHLGRESFLAPVEWTEDGWPVFGDNRRVALQMAGPPLPRHPFPAPMVRDDFESPGFDLEWNYIRNPRAEHYDLTSRPGWLRLHGTAVSLRDFDSPTALIRRQRHFETSFGTRLDFQPQHEGEIAGLCLRQNEALHVEFGITQKHGKRMLVLRRTDRDESILLHETVLPDGTVDLLVEANRDTFTFHYQLPDGSKVRAGEVDTNAISVEASWDRGIACFTGLMIGIYATGNGSGAATPADFDWFDYQPDSTR